MELRHYHGLRKTVMRLAGAGVLVLCFAAGPAQAEDSENGETAVQLPTVSVSGAAESSEDDGSAQNGYRVSKVQVGPLGEQSIQDVPLSIDAVSSDFIKNTGATNTAEALRYVPTVYVNTGSSGITPYFTLRGFSASAWTYNMSVDGMRSFDFWEPLEDKERLEVLRGAAGFLYGVTSPGGMINYVTKQPTEKKHREITLTETGEQVGGAVDVGGPLSAGSAFGYRVNLSYATPSTNFTDRQNEERSLASGVMDWNFAPGSKAFVEAAFARHDLKYAQPLFMTSSSVGIPKAPHTWKHFGSYDDGATDTTTRVGAGFESKLNDIFTWRGRFRYSDIARSYALTRQQWQDTNLDYSVRRDSQNTFDNLVTQLNTFMDAKFDTGKLAHKVTLGITWDNFHGGNEHYLCQTTNNTSTIYYSGNLYNDNGVPDYVYDSISGTSTYQRTTYQDVILSDQIAFGPKWGLMLGATQASIDDLSISTTTATGAVTNRTRYDKSRIVPAVTLSFKPIPKLTTYVSYLESLQQGLVVTDSSKKSYSNVGQAFSPYVSHQYEAGAKATLGGMNLAAALFRVDKASELAEGNIDTQDGREVHTGMEFSATGKITDRLTLVGGFTALKAKITKASSYEGCTPQGVPERMARLYAEYELPGMKGLFVNAGASYTGRVPWDSADKLYVSPVTLFDAGLRYTQKVMGHPLTARLVATNLTGVDYWTTRSGILYLGNPRTITLSLSTEF